MARTVPVNLTTDEVKLLLKAVSHASDSPKFRGDAARLERLFFKLDAARR